MPTKVGTAWPAAPMAVDSNPSNTKKTKTLFTVSPFKSGLTNSILTRWFRAGKAQKAQLVREPDFGHDWRKKEIFEREHMTLVRRIPLLVLAVFVFSRRLSVKPAALFEGRCKTPRARSSRAPSHCHMARKKDQPCGIHEHKQAIRVQAESIRWNSGRAASVSSVRLQNQREVSRMRCGQLWKLPLHPAITGTLGAVGQGEHLSVTSVAVRNLEKRAVCNSVISGKPMTSS